MLVMLSLPFIAFFLQVFWSKFETLFKFFSQKTNKFWTKISSLLLSPVSFSSCSLPFLVHPNLPIVFFSRFLSLFLVFAIRLNFLGICFRSTFTFFKSLDFSSCFWLAPFNEGSKMILAPLLQVFCSCSSYRIYSGFGSFFPTSRFTFKYTFARHSSHHKNVLFLIPRNGRPKERGKRD